jgi:selenocysteine-specific elongation factor
VAVDEVDRGDVLADADSDLRSTYLIDARLDLAGEPGARVQVHHGTRETPARTASLGGSFWQLRLEQPLVPAPGDRVVIRQIAPPDTLGGGVVLDAHPRKHGPSRALLVRLERLARGEPADRPSDLDGTGPTRQRDRAGSRQRHQPVPLSASAQAVEQRLRDAGLEPPPDSQLNGNDLTALREANRVVRVAKNLHFHPEALAEARDHIIALAKRNGGAVTLAQLRDELQTSRKFAQALLEHFDSEKLTIRRGDEHVLRRRAL